MTLILTNEEIETLFTLRNVSILGAGAARSVP